jgi:hypothetical protein
MNHKCARQIRKKATQCHTQCIWIIVQK